MRHSIAYKACYKLIWFVM